MTQESAAKRLDRRVDEATDHVLGPPDAEMTLLEYGSYACPPCETANELIIRVREEFGDRLRYVYRHRPVSGSAVARRAAELVERIDDPDVFWDTHVSLMERSRTLTEEDLQALEEELGLGADESEGAHAATQRARARVDADVASAQASGARVSPTFFINGRRYEGLWEESALTDALLGSLGHRVRSAALDFARWAPSAGLLLLFTTILAIVLTNSALGDWFASIWQTEIGIGVGGAELRMSLLRWVNDGLLTIFFLVVGLEIKREFTIGHLSSRRSAALPVAAAAGGMIVPALLYMLVIPNGAWADGWGVPMATDTAFAVALIVMMGSRVPVALRVFLTAAAIVDDIGAITVVAVFYSHGLDAGYLLGAAACVVALAVLARLSVYRVWPYAVLGLALWVLLESGGLHATLAGVILALFIPTRPPANLRAMLAQYSSIITAEARRSRALTHGPSEPAIRALDAIHDRLESPADGMLRIVSVRSSYIVLPVFALANAGVVISLDALDGRGWLVAAVMLGLVVGKPVGLLGFSALAVRLHVADKPDEYSWRQVAGAGALAGIGFTMSLFIAGQAFPEAGDYSAAKIAIFAASFVSAVIGIILLWSAGREQTDTA